MILSAVSSGRGYVVPLVWVASSAILGLVFEQKGGNNMVIALMITMTICTYLGKRWKRQREEWEAQNDMPSPKPRNTFIFVPLEHIWVPCLLLIAAIVAVSGYYGHLSW